MGGGGERDGCACVRECVCVGASTAVPGSGRGVTGVMGPDGAGWSSSLCARWSRSAASSCG